VVSLAGDHTLVPKAQALERNIVDLTDEVAALRHPFPRFPVMCPTQALNSIECQLQRAIGRRPRQVNRAKNTVQCHMV